MIWRLCIRHAFFATGHACSFNRLHFSAAFVAFEKFHFATAGVSLFLNTFGWEVLGMCFLANTCRVSNRQDVMSWYCFYQMVETFVSCVSVSILRRHLMVWAIFAPRFVFSAIYLLICSAYTTIHIASSRQDAKRQDHKHDQ
jgi:phosphatidylinositol glycan class O